MGTLVDPPFLPTFASHHRNPNNMPPTELVPYIDGDLPPIRKVPLGKFCEKYHALAHEFSDGKPWEFGEHTTLGLTGRYQDALLQEHRLQITNDSTPIGPDELDQTADVDSVIGWLFQGDPFPLLPNHSIFLYVLNNPAYTLSSSLHIDPFEFVDEQGEKTGQASDSNTLSLCLPAYCVISGCTLA